MNPEIVAAIDPHRSARPAVQRFCTLPNGLEIACQSAKETEHIYEDIFEHRVYLSHGITLWDGATVFDVGGNIGLFSLFVHQHFREVVTYTFEPAPPLFEILRYNLATHGGKAKLFHCGVSSRSGMARLTFYPFSSGMSSFYGDLSEEKEVLRTVLKNQRQRGQSEVEEVLAAEEEFLDARFTEQSFDCPLVTLSQIIRQEGVETVDLLKLDVQKSELDVLLGLEREDWPRVRQIALEVHDLDGRLGTVLNLLEERGYRVVSEQDPLYRGSVMYNLFAVHKDLHRTREASQARQPAEAQRAAAARSARSKEAFSRLRGARGGT